MAKHHRMKFCEKPKAERKKKQKHPETLISCENCGVWLGRTCARTPQSACCAVAEGISVGYFVEDGKRVPHFFCCKECENEFAAEYKQQLLPLLPLKVTVP